MWLPKWMYEALPYMWLFCGVTAIANITHWLAFFSGSLFVMAGGLIFALRTEARKRKVEPK